MNLTWSVFSYRDTMAAIGPLQIVAICLFDYCDLVNINFWECYDLFW